MTKPNQAMYHSEDDDMATRKQPYFPFYYKDYEACDRLKECCAATHGVYVWIMFLMHKQDTYGKLKIKDEYREKNMVEAFTNQLRTQLPNKIQKSEIFCAINELILEKICEIKGDFFIQKRMMRDGKTSKHRAIAGKKGGKFAQAKLKQNTANANANAIAYNNFNIFYEKYPRKTQRKEAEKSFIKLNPNEDLLSVILKDIEDRLGARTWNLEEKNFIPHPATYLNQQRWEDEIIPGRKEKEDWI